MKIQLNTDVNIHGTEALAAQVSASVEQALEHFKEHITRVEVHLSDENSGSSGQHDHRCMLEARLEGQQPMAVTEHAATLDQAVHGAAQKLAHLLDSRLGRLNNHHKKTSGMPFSEGEPDMPFSEGEPE
ncbi:MAG: ribosome-associated translation inhibitor RaiA [Cellvibrionaceae bacterium]|jgi:ribosome-associated translation inhibitor RaiA